MALAKVRGYQILLTFGTKTIVGTTSDSFSGGGTLKESIQKSDAGQKNFTNVGFEGSLSVNAFVHTGAAAATEMGIEELLNAAKNNTSGTFVFSFGTTGSSKWTGTAYVTSVTVNSNSEDYADCSIELAIKEKPTQGTV